MDSRETRKARKTRSLADLDSTSEHSTMPAASLISAASGSPPAKKLRLKLNVKPLSPSDSTGDSIAVSRPKRSTTLKLHNPLSNSTAKDTEYWSTPHPPGRVRKSEPVLTNSATPAHDRSESQKDEYGDFMSYYIDDSGDGGAEVDQASAVTWAREGSTHFPGTTPCAPILLDEACSSKKSRSQAKRTTGSKSQSARRESGQSTSSMNATNELTLQRGPMLTTSIHLPKIEFRDIQLDAKPSEMDDVATMIAKLKGLSETLTEFGGVPPAPTTPPLNERSDPIAQHIKAFHTRSDIQEDKEIDLNHKLQYPGIEDGPLTHGIQFIQNALKSWAQQRLTQQMMDQMQSYRQSLAPERAPQRAPDLQRRGLGRQLRSDEVSSVQMGATLQVDLGETPEGVAIKAFQSVLNSGCLRVNAVLPVELAQALRHLYAQIDHLIIKGTRSETGLECMSYSAQIAAHKARVANSRKAPVMLHKEHGNQRASMTHQHYMTHDQIFGGESTGVPLQPRFHVDIPVAGQDNRADDLLLRSSLAQPRSITTQKSKVSEENSPLKQDAGTKHPENSKLSPKTKTRTSLRNSIERDKVKTPQAHANGTYDTFPARRKHVDLNEGVDASCDDSGHLLRKSGKRREGKLLTSKASSSNSNPSKLPQRNLETIYIDDSPNSSLDEELRFGTALQKK